MSDFYAKAKESFLSQSPSIDLDTDTINVALMRSSYSPLTATDGHQYWSSISASAAATATLTSKTVTGGVFDAADVTFASVTGTAEVNALVLYKNISTAATSSPLICYLNNSTGLPLNPNGSDIVISWSNDANKIFRL